MSSIWWILPLLAGAAVAWFVRGRTASPPPADEVGRLQDELRRRVALDQARTRFFGDIVEQIRPPLTVVLGHLESAATQDDPVARNRALRTAARNARRIARLTGQAADLTRLEAGALETSLRDVDVAAYLGTLVLSFEELADRKGLMLEYLARPRSIPSRVDPEHLTTIVSNLVSNALGHTPPGGRVGVAVETRDDVEGPVLRIVVSDTGLGIPAHLHEEIFEPFARGPGREHERRPGIGLALVREVVRLHGGSVTVESDPGRGARFVVKLPHHGPVVPTGEPLMALGVRPEITEEILYRTTAEVHAAETVEGRPTILLASHTEELGRWVAGELEAIGDVSPVQDGSSALRLAQERVPDVVVVEAHPPQVDGLAVCRRFRADERTSHIPVLLLSVRDEVEHRVAALNSGADDVVGLPVDGRELRARIVRLLERRAALREEFRARVSVRTRDAEATSVDQEFLDQVVDAIEGALSDQDYSVAELADAVALSTSQLTRKLRSLLGRTPAQLIRSLRLRRGAELLAARAGSVGRIAYSLGFADQSHFTRCFKREYGLTPTAYRERAAGSAEAQIPSLPEPPVEGR